MNSYAQCRQDLFLDAMMERRQGGVFVDVGAHDGVTFSNTAYFERFRFFHGLCVEPSPIAFPKLRENRACVCVNCAVSNFEGVAEFQLATDERWPISHLKGTNPNKYDRVEKEYVGKYGGTFETVGVPVRTLQSLLIEHGISKIDYLSIDVEGEEMRVLESIDFKKTRINFLSIENNDGNPMFANFLWPHGFRLTQRVDQDEIFQNWFDK